MNIKEHISQKKVKIIYDKFSNKLEKIDYFKAILNLQKDFKLTDLQWQIVKRYLVYTFSTPIIDSYINQNIRKINYRKKFKLNQKTAIKIYSVAVSYINDNRILLNSEIVD